jgi:hypothetical protein
MDRRKLNKGYQGPTPDWDKIKDMIRGAFPNSNYPEYIRLVQGISMIVRETFQVSNVAYLNREQLRFAEHIVKMLIDEINKMKEQKSPSPSAKIVR